MHGGKCRVRSQPFNLKECFITYCYYCYHLFCLSHQSSCIFKTGKIKAMLATHVVPLFSCGTHSTYGNKNAVLTPAKLVGEESRGDRGDFVTHLYKD